MHLLTGSAAAVVRPDVLLEVHLLN